MEILNLGVHISFEIFWSLLYEHFRRQKGRGRGGWRGGGGGGYAQSRLFGKCTMLANCMEHQPLRVLRELIRADGDP